jgi:uncharacterized protein (TIGR03118 family)
MLASLTFGGVVAADNASFYTVHNLVSDSIDPHATLDPNLKNGWGIVFAPGTSPTTGSPAWVADNGTGKSTLYNGDGTIVSLVVTIPAPGTTSGGAPTGIVANTGSTTDFVFTDSGKTGRAAFIFSTEDGTIAAWSPAVNATQAIIMFPPSNVIPTAIYKGLAIANNGTETFLYASDFHNGRIDVFNSNFALTTLTGNFADPKLPSGYGPFGIQSINGHIYVAYAKQDADAEDEIAGQGRGIVDEFTADGQFVRRVAQHGQLNAPWGMALAPANFGCFSNALLVGNFGDGRINAFDLASGELLGPLRGQDHKRIVVDGLWGIAFGNGNLTRDQPKNVLFFAAGPNDENDGLFGRIEASGAGACIASDDD